MVLEHVQAALGAALAGDARADDLGQPVDVEGLDARVHLDALAHLRRQLVAALAQEGGGLGDAVGARDREPLPLAARELVRVALRLIRRQRATACWQRACP